MSRRRIPALVPLLALALLWGSFPPSAHAAGPARIDRRLVAALAAGGPVAAIAVLPDQVRPSAGGRATSATRRALVESLRGLATARQAPLLAELSRRAPGEATDIRPLWIQNAIALRATPATVDWLAGSGLVAEIRIDATIPAPDAPPGGTPVEWNLETVGAPTVWAEGITGQGVVVANLDTGIDLANPDLNAAWRGGADSWFDPYGQHATPADLNGHGTATMGVMVGGWAGGSAIGMAPDAEWIAAKIFNDSGTATASAIHLAYQWLLDPDGNPATDDAPDVVNNSWSDGGPDCSLEFEPDLAALVAAGITPVFAAGNFGPGAGTSTSPGNNPSAFAIGATDSGDAIWVSSSRGPSDCDGSAGTYPDLVAPGAGVTIADRFGLYSSASGTSLAAPHVAGAIALMLAAHPGLSVAEQRAALEATAVDLGAPGPDNAYGGGRIDVAAAVEAVGIIPASDVTGPNLVGLAAGLNPTMGATAVELSGQATDPPNGAGAPSAVVAAEWFDGADPGEGLGVPLAGSYGSPTATFSDIIDVSGWSAGTHPIGVRARDEAGNWGPLARTPLLVVPSDTIFADGFTGGTVAWAETSGTAQPVSIGEPDPGAWLEVSANAGGGGFVLDTSPSAELSYRARFVLDPGWATTAGAGHAVLVANGSGGMRFKVLYRNAAAGAEVRLVVATATGLRKTPWESVDPAAATVIEVSWRAGSHAHQRLYLDGELRRALLRLDTDGTVIQRTRIGIMGSTADVFGTERFDEFVSTRGSEIGP